MVTSEFILLLVGAYLLGSIPAAQLLAKTRGIDLKQYGSGNVGASNLARATSRRMAIPVYIFDFGKGALAVYLAKLLDMDVYQQIAIGVAAISGHNWPVFLHFNGGRGVLTTLGVVVVLVPWLGLVTMGIALIFAPLRQLALGVLLAGIFLPIASWFFGPLIGNADKTPLTLGLMVMFLIVVLRRLLAPPTTLTATVSRRELIVNRLLFDRDIRNREMWINRPSSR